MPREAALLELFEQMSAEVRELELVPKDQGMLWYAAGKVLSKVMVPRSPSLEEGDSYDAVMSRASYKLQQGDLEGALQEVQSLQLSECAQWTEMASQRLRVSQVIAALSAYSRDQARAMEKALREAEAAMKQ